MNEMMKLLVFVVTTLIESTMCHQFSLKGLGFIERTTNELSTYSFRTSRYGRVPSRVLGRPSRARRYVDSRYWVVFFFPRYRFFFFIWQIIILIGFKTTEFTNQSFNCPLMAHTSSVIRTQHH